MVSTKEFSIVIQLCFLISFLWPIAKGCEVGYFGPECGEKCRFPNYGSRCQLKCDCFEKYCNHINGCRNFSSANSSVFPQTVESGLIAVTGTPDEERSKTEIKTGMMCKIKKRTATMRPFLFTIIGVAVVALLITASYTYVTLSSDQRNGPNNIELIV
ncbi:uncharacterized protein LOC111111039 [Crassostrea virginica]